MAHPPPQGAPSPTDRRPPAPGARPPLDPVALRRAGRATTRFGLLALVAVLATALPLPWGLAAIPFTAAALAAGVVALVATVRARVRAAPVVVLSVGLALVTALLAALLVQLLFYPVVASAQECQRAAITEQAREQCDEELQTEVFDRAFGR